MMNTKRDWYMSLITQTNVPITLRKNNFRMKYSMVLKDFMMKVPVQKNHELLKIIEKFPRLGLHFHRI